MIIFIQTLAQLPPSNAWTGSCSYQKEISEIFSIPSSVEISVPDKKVLIMAPWGNPFEHIWDVFYEMHLIKVSALISTIIMQHPDMNIQ